MNSLSDLAYDVVMSVQRLAAALEGKSVTLSPAAQEDMGYSLHEMLRRLDSHRGQIERNLVRTDKRANSLRDLARNIASSAEALAVALQKGNRKLLGNARLRPWVRRNVRNTLLELMRQLNSYADQIERRFVDSHVDVLGAQEETFPYQAARFVPFSDSGFLAFVEGSPPGVLAIDSQAASDESGAAAGEVAVEIYIGSDDESKIDRVVQSAQELVEALGYKEVGEAEIRRGSIFRRSRAVAQVGLDELKIRLMKVERGLELAQLDLRQAEVNAKESEAVSGLLTSLEGVDRACIRVGSLLVVKYQFNGAPVIFVRTLNQLEMHALTRFPEIQANPERALHALATAVVSLSDLEADGGDTALTEGTS
ncbi:hypothetical protein [Streptomyces avermitilis]|uniref:hypothetical protein n=1 Tax=Streptomyces avermitilis TaxID=33903 RepID=UPI00369348CF